MLTGPMNKQGNFLFHYTFFYKNNFIRTKLKFGQKLRTTLEQSGLGFGIMIAKFASLNKILLFFSNSTVLSVEIFQMLRSIEFPLRFIWIDDHKLGIFGIF